MIKIEVPIYITLPRKTKKDKKYMLNLNQYRNWHYIVSNQLKHRFCEALECSLSDLKLKDELDITYTLYKGSKRKIDRANVLCIVEKFFCDALTFYKCIPDDNDDYIKATHYYSDYDKDNPRVEITIKTYDKSN
jgi:hypothetical protein